MQLKYYNRIWYFVLFFLSAEFYSLNFKPSMSMLNYFGFKFTPEPGRQLSLILGWAGMVIMLLMNLYILRKRFSFMKGTGSLSSWLNFHICCGLVGPTLILFHCNFKVRGLVAISFWSMCVSASSGIIGRYFYLQLLERKQELKDEAKRWAEELAHMQRQTVPPISDENMSKIKRKALTYVGVTAQGVGIDGTLQINALHVFFSSLAGDLRLLVDLPKTLAGLPGRSREILRRYALAERRALFLEPFRNLMGHWHTFHTPFAIFMYLAAIIHIAAALLLGVKK